MYWLYKARIQSRYCLFGGNESWEKDCHFREHYQVSHSVFLSFRFVSRMKYPNRLSPQQIQGMDYKAMETLLTWLKEKIIEVRNSLPCYESLAAQRLFEDEFCFDASDAPPDAVSSLWFPVHSTLSSDFQSTAMLSCQTASTISHHLPLSLTRSFSLQSALHRHLHRLSAGSELSSGWNLQRQCIHGFRFRR